MSQNIIPCKSILNIEQKNKIRNWIYHKPGIHHAVEFLSTKCQIQITSDPDVVKGFERDSSNIPGNAEILCYPINDNDAPLFLRTAGVQKSP